VIVAHFEGVETLLEASVLIDGLATYRGRVVGITGASGEGYLQTRLADIVEAHVDRNAEVAAVARNEVPEAETKARRNFAEVDATCAVERVGSAAVVVLAVKGNRTTGWDEGSGQNAIIVSEDNQRTEAEVAAEREPVEGRVAGAEL